MRFPTVIALSLIGLSLPVKAENLSHLRQLLATKDCSSCDLSGAGLVTANLVGAKLNQANLVNANLSQANLSGADLSGANLTGASLYGANLSGANLTGAMLNGTDLREAYLANAILEGAYLETAYIEGVEAMPLNAASPELFLNWGLIETKEGNYTSAIEHFDKALVLKPQLATAYLGKGFVLFRTGNEQEAAQNLEVASALYKEQKNTQGHETAEGFIERIEAIQEARARNASDLQLGNLVRGVGGLLLKFLPGLL